MNLVLKFWEYISSIGVNSNVPSDKVGSIRITNQTVTLVSLLAISYFLYGQVFLSAEAHSNHPLFFAFHIGIGMSFLLVFVLNKYKWNKSASFIIIALVYALATINSLHLQLPYRTENYYLLLTAFSFMVYKRQQIILPIFLVQACTYYYVTRAILSQHPHLLESLPGLEFRVAILFSILFFILYFLKTATIKYKQRLEEKTIQLSQDHEALEKLNFTKDKIFSIISHDLRSPINSLQLMLGLLSDDHLTIEEFKKATSGLEKQVGQLHTSLNEMLVWSKAQLSGIDPIPETFQLRSVIREVVAVNKVVARNKKIILTSSIPQEEHVTCDPNMLKSVITNLVANAIKFTPKGGAVSLYCTTKNREVKICVEDTGVGVPKENQSKIMDKSIHMTTFGTNKEKGTGLGLIMCVEFIEKNGGTLSLQSEQGKGSIFTIVLPA